VAASAADDTATPSSTAAETSSPLPVCESTTSASGEQTPEEQIDLEFAGTGQEPTSCSTDDVDLSLDTETSVTTAIAAAEQGPQASLVAGQNDAVVTEEIAPTDENPSAAPCSTLEMENVNLTAVEDLNDADEAGGAEKHEGKWLCCGCHLFQLIFYVCQTLKPTIRVCCKLSRNRKSSALFPRLCDDSDLPLISFHIFNQSSQRYQQIVLIGNRYHENCTHAQFLQKQNLFGRIRTADVYSHVISIPF